MKKVVYCVVALFLTGGAMCNNQQPVVNNPPAQSTDGTKPADQNPGPKAEMKKPEDLSYANDIKPFFTTHCAECHSGPRAKAGYSLDGYETLLWKGRKGPAVVPGDADNSLVVRALTGQGAKRMPPPMYKHQPKPEDVEMLKAWIAAGARDDSAKGE